MGRATALTFAREGASVVGCDVMVEPAERPSRWLRRGWRDGVAAAVPSRRSRRMRRLVELAVSEFGRIDVLFNLAARSHFSRFEGFTDEEWEPPAGTRSTWCSTSPVRPGPT